MDKSKLGKLARGTALAAAGAGLAYLSAHLGDVDLGKYGPALAAVLSVAVNAVRLMAGGGQDRK